MSSTVTSLNMQVGAMAFPFDESQALLPVDPYSAKASW
jgi:hypothetical protein